MKFLSTITFSVLASIVLLIAPVGLHAQQITKVNYSVLQKMNDDRNPLRDIAVFVQGDIETISQITEANGGVVKYHAGDIAAVVMPVNKLHLLLQSDKITRIEDSPEGLRPLNDRMVVNNNIILVHMGFSPLPQGYDGEGVVVGIIDTGIDFSHPDFKDAAGKSRIKYIWDHTLSGQGNSPAPYNYGREFTNAKIDSGQAGAHFDKFFGHGTHVSGIAAGNGLALNNYVGAAPKSDIIAVALDFNKPDSDWLSSIVDATDYIYKKAQAMGKPCVINASVGTYLGSHDGRDLQAQLIGNLISAQNGRSFVCAAGNSGSVPFHAGFNLTSDTLFTWVKQTSGNIIMQFWADSTNASNALFAIGSDKVTPSFSYAGRTPFRALNYSTGLVFTDTVKNNNGDRIARVDRYNDFIGDRYVITYNIWPDSANYNWRLMGTGTGRFDMWNFDLISSGLPNTNVYPEMVNHRPPDTDQTIVSSFSCHPKVITVGEYVNRNSYTDVNGVIQYLGVVEGSLAASSSKGPTRDGRTKPEISSTGNATLAPIVLADAQLFIVNNPFKVAAGGKHIRDGGTSSASPVVAGAVALYLQRYPNATYQDIRDAFFNCTKTDQFTGVTPNNSWGYGKLNAYAALNNCITDVAPQAIAAHSELVAHPNPTHGHGFILFSHPTLTDARTASIEFYDLPGRMVKRFKISPADNNIELHTGDLRSGSYLYSLIIDGRVVATNKLIVF